MCQWGGKRRRTIDSLAVLNLLGHKSPELILNSVSSFLTLIRYRLQSTASNHTLRRVAMKEFLLLFRGGEEGMTAAQQSPEKFQQHMMKWKTWMESLGKQGKFIAGQPLSPEGSVITGTRRVVTDGPFVEGKEIVGGYLMMKATDLSDAIESSKNCPIFDYDGVVEVREVQQLSM
jgi:hypothetical protein